MDIFDIPTEILARIFADCNLLTVACVCRQWREIVHLLDETEANRAAYALGLVDELVPLPFRKVNDIAHPRTLAFVRELYPHRATNAWMWSRGARPAFKSRFTAVLACQIYVMHGHRAQLKQTMLDFDIRMHEVARVTDSLYDRGQSVEVYQNMVSFGLPLNALRGRQYQLLYIAAGQYFETVQYLVELLDPTADEIYALEHRIIGASKTLQIFRYLMDRFYRPGKSTGIYRIAGMLMPTALGHAIVAKDYTFFQYICRATLLSKRRLAQTRLLQKAANNGASEIVQYLLKCTPEPDYSDLFIRACRANDVSTLRHILSHVPADTLGRAEYHHLPVVRFMFEEAGLTVMPEISNILVSGPDPSVARVKYILSKLELPPADYAKVLGECIMFPSVFVYLVRRFKMTKEVIAAGDNRYIGGVDLAIYKCMIGDLKMTIAEVADFATVRCAPDAFAYLISRGLTLQHINTNYTLTLSYIYDHYPEYTIRLIDQLYTKDTILQRRPVGSPCILCKCCANGDKDIFDHLITTMSITIDDLRGTNVIRAALLGKSTLIVRQLSQMGADLSLARTPTLIDSLCYSSNTAMIKYLVTNSHLTLGDIIAGTDLCRCGVKIIRLVLDLGMTSEMVEDHRYRKRLIKSCEPDLGLHCRITSLLAN